MDTLGQVAEDMIGRGKEPVFEVYVIEIVKVSYELVRSYELFIVTSPIFRNPIQGQENESILIVYR